MHVVIPIPNSDFDPTEVAVTWKTLHDAGYRVTFATPDGRPGRADELMLTGRGLDPWSIVPGLSWVRFMGAILAANGTALAAYRELEADPSFQAPVTYAALSAADYDALALPGGHRALGMKAYLESEPLAAFVADMFDAKKPVGAICHGVVVAARARSKATGRSVLYGRRTTALTWKQENLAWRIGRVFRFWDPNYYRTYTEKPGEPAGYRSVQSEVTRELERPEDFLDVEPGTPDYALKTDGRHRDTPSDSRPAFVVRDGNYVSARWPGDVHLFAKTLVSVIAESGAAAATAEPVTPLAIDSP
jgi:putative intracellular protease/amidase